MAGLGTIFFLTPMMGWTWPALLPIATAAGAALGYKCLGAHGNNKGLFRSRLTRKLENMRRVEIALDSVLAEVISEDLGHEERLMFERDDIKLVFRKDAVGKFYVEVSGPSSASTQSLKTRGEEFSRELIKKFAYHKIVEQIERRGATIIDEELTDDGRNVIRCRQWR